MKPALTRRGKLVAASGAWFALVGTLLASPPLTALGGVILSSLCSAYLWFFPTAIALRRRRVELSWWVPITPKTSGLTTAGQSVALSIAFRNSSRRSLRVHNTELFTTSGLRATPLAETAVPPGHQVELSCQLRTLQPGYQVLHGASLRFGDLLGMFHVDAFFPNPLGMQVYPRPPGIAPVGRVAPIAAGRHQRAGVHLVKRRGQAGELREIREHTPGDPFRMIAWKPSARRGRLMVRENEAELVVTHQVLVDIGGAMRRGPPGETALDYAVGLATAWAKSALDGGDRVGLCTFDTRIHAALAPNDGHHHYLQIVDRLIDSYSIVDADLTEVTASELTTAVARYLAHQEGIRVHVTHSPALDSPDWDRLMPGARGELYDLGLTDSAISALIRNTRAPKGRGGAPLARWKSRYATYDGDARMSRMRLFCRLRGIELPYCSRPEFGAQAQGFISALDKTASQSRADVVVIISALAGLSERPNEVLRALGRVQGRGRRVIAVCPFEPWFSPIPAGRAGAAVARAVRNAQQDALDDSRRLLASRGIGVLLAGPQDTPGQLLARLRRTSGRGMAEGRPPHPSSRG